MAKKTTIKNGSGDILYPQTVTTNIYSESGTRLDTTLSNLDTKIETYSSANATEISQLKNTTQQLPTKQYVSEEITKAQLDTSVIDTSNIVMQSDLQGIYKESDFSNSSYFEFEIGAVNGSMVDIESDIYLRSKRKIYVKQNVDYEIQYDNTESITIGVSRNNDIRWMESGDSVTFSQNESRLIIKKYDGSSITTSDISDLRLTFKKKDKESKTTKIKFTLEQGTFQDNGTHVSSNIMLRVKDKLNVDTNARYLIKVKSDYLIVINTLSGDGT